MRSTILCLLLLVRCAFAADLSGKWRVDSKFPRGDAITEYLDLQSTDTVLSGLFTDAFGGGHEIHDGKVNGDNISFWIPWEEEQCKVTGVLRQGILELKLVTSKATRTAQGKRINKG